MTTPTKPPAKMGRKPNVPKLTRRYIMLDAETLERARLLGAGNVSGGIREALRRVRLPFEAEPPG